MRYQDLLGNTPINEVPIAHQHSLEELLKRVRLIESLWGSQFVVTSGYRSNQDHLRIYSEINARRIKRGLQPLSIPMKSAHLIGKACDIYDPGFKLHEFCKKNESVLETIELWCEERDDQERVHFQTCAPKSGKRFFYP